MLVVCAVSEFLTFVVNQELCQKQWYEAELLCAELNAQYSKLESDNEALKTKLKHARFVVHSFKLC